MYKKGDIMKVEKDKVVSLHYTLSLANGEIIDSSRGGEPFTFLVGHQQIIPGLEAGLMGMQEGEKKTVQVAAKDAYGERDENLVQTVDRSLIPETIELYEGLVLSGRSESGHEIEVVVKSFNDREVVLDMNHPLAGEDLTFDVEILEIRDATPEELAHGHAH
jgi:FKBP-type peptidyl-prolyl cis-trans isomerase SlyD